MSAIVILVFAPVVVVMLLFVAVLLSAATAGAWEAGEGRAEGTPSASPLAGARAIQRSEFPLGGWRRSGATPQRLAWRPERRCVAVRTGSR